MALVLLMVNRFIYEFAKIARYHHEQYWESDRNSHFYKIHAQYAHSSYKVISSSIPKYKVATYIINLIIGYAYFFICTLAIPLVIIM